MTDPERSDGNDPAEDDGVVEEPENSTVDDWRGQRIERDTELAERIADETDDPDDAAERFEEESEGPPPEDLPTEERRV